MIFSKFPVHKIGQGIFKTCAFSLVTLFFLINFYFKVVLDLQRSCKDSPKSFHLPWIRPPLLLTSYITRVHLFELTHLYSYIIINRSLCFLTFYVIVFQRPIQETTLRLVILSPQTPLDYDSYSGFSCFLILFVLFICI